MYKLLILFSAILLIPNFAFSQNSVGKTTGRVVTQNDFPLSEVAVKLISHIDSTKSWKFKTDNNGFFALSFPSDGIYKIIFSKKNYEPKVFMLNSADTNQLRIVKMSAASVELKQVEISGTRKYVKKMLDRTSIVIDGNSLYQGFNVLDMFKMMPGVNIDASDNVQLNGSKKVKFMIDGRELKLTGDVLKAFLKTLSSNDISNIELMSNPSSRFDADGTAGIINIIRKKNQTEGVKGSVSVSYADNGYSQFTINPDIEYKKKNTIIDVNLGKTQEIERNNIDESRFFYNTGQNYRQDRFMINDKRNNYFSFGITQNVNSNNILNIEFGYSSFKSNPNSQYLTNIDSLNYKTNSTTSDLYTTSLKNPYLSLNYHCNIDTIGSTFDVNFDTWVNKSNFNRDLNSFENDLITEQVVSHQYDNTKIYTLKTDYQKKYKSGSQLTMGAKGSVINDKNELGYPVLLTKIPGKQFGGTFHYKEVITALYGNFSLPAIAGWQSQYGLRMESASNQSDFEQREAVKKNQLYFFPSVFLLKPFKNKFLTQLNFSYSKRINRPRLDDLNPVLQYSTPYSYVEGNLQLIPEMVHKFESSLSFISDLSLNTSYEIHSQVLSNVTYTVVGSDLFYLQSQNLAKYRSFISGLEFPYNYKKLHIRASVVYTYDWYNSRLEDNSVLINNRANFYANLTGVLRLDNNFSIRAQTFYKGPYAYGQTVYQYRTSANLSVLKKWSDGLSLSITVYDPLYTDKEIFNVYSSSQQAKTINKFNSRKLEFYLSYDFGSKKTFNRNAISKGNDDEVNRKH